MFIFRLTIDDPFSIKNGLATTTVYSAVLAFFSISLFFASACVEEKDVCDVLFRL
jgi:hypothetical protein